LDAGNACGRTFPGLPGRLLPRAGPNGRGAPRGLKVVDDQLTGSHRLGLVGHLYCCGHVDLSGISHDGPARTQLLGKELIGDRLFHGGPGGGGAAAQVLHDPPRVTDRGLVGDQERDHALAAETLHLVAVTTQPGDADLVELEPLPPKLTGHLPTGADPVAGKPASVESGHQRSVPAVQ
jgi:hypothetical protein